MSNHEIAQLLRTVSVAYTIQDEKKFRFQILAYQKAADAIDSAVTEVKDLYKEGKLHTIPGVGPSIQEYLTELCKTGRVKHFETITSSIPAAVFPLLSVTSFGPKKAFRLVSHFHLNNPKRVISDIKKLAEEGKIETLEGFGKKSQEEILKAIQEFEKNKPAPERMPLPFAIEFAEQVISYMKTCKEVKEIYPLGSLRRNVETIGDIDLGVATDNATLVLDHFETYPYKTRVLDRGDVSASLMATNGRRVDIKTQSPQSFGALLQHFTGSKEHNVHLREIALKKGFSLSEKGIKKRKANGTWYMEEFREEQKFYKALGMEWIPPEMREDAGEIELALKKQLPKLVELSDIHGDFHIHSNFPMEESHDAGTSPILTMLEKAKKLGYTFLSFSEHNPSISKHSNNEVYELIHKRNAYIDKIYSNNKSVRVIKMLETDILVNGDLAVDDRSLSLLDATIVSIHSSFHMNRKSMTERIIRGLSHPKAKILAHPTGRLINQRSGYDVDWDTLFRFCEKNNKALEINSFPSRLDLPDALIRQAKEYHIKFAIDTDSHAVEHMDLMKYGVTVARRGWLTKDDLLNCMEYNACIEWLRR